jgi:hypothetical protein
MAEFITKLKSLLGRIPLKVALMVYAVAITCVALTLVFLLVTTKQSFQRSSDEVTRKEKARDTQLALYDKPSLTPAGDKIFFPEMKLTIPATAAAKSLLYRFTPSAFGNGGTTTPEVASFASRTAIYNTSKPDGDEKCNVIAEATFGQKFAEGSEHSLDYYTSVTLADGRTMYIYQNKADCSMEWGDLDSGSLVMLLRQATASAGN